MLNEIQLLAKKILLIGDVMIDYYHTGDISRISPEAPVPIFNKTGERKSLGGAANVALNLLAANQKVTLVSIVGNDSDGGYILKELQDKGIDCSLVVPVNGVQTTSKSRYITNKKQHVLRIDVDSVIGNISTQRLELLEYIKHGVVNQEWDIVLISDYNKGLISDDFAKSLMDIFRALEIKIIVDTKSNLPTKYLGCDIIKPNLGELQKMLGLDQLNERSKIVNASKKLKNICGCESVITTCGKHGMLLVDEKDMATEIPSKPVEVFDVTGAGDTALAYLGCLIANNHSILEAAQVANIAAGLQVTKSGASPVAIVEVNEWLGNSRKSKVSKDRVLLFEQLHELRRINNDKTIVFTNGCFDILHSGHVSCLRQAASLGDVLVVGVNSDISVRKIKGKNRPIYSLDERIEMISSLEFVNHVIVFDEDTPINIIEELSPDILVKGSEYKSEEVTGRKFIESLGGRIVLIPMRESISTTIVIERILNAERQLLEE